jgi:hypothetical protein
VVAAPKIRRDDKGKQQEFAEKTRKELSWEGLCKKEIIRGEGFFSK